MSNPTVSVSVSTPAFDAANSIGERLYKAVEQLANKEEKTIDVVREALESAIERHPSAFDDGEHVVGCLVYAFSLWVARSERKLKAAIAAGDLGTRKEKGVEIPHTEATFTYNQLSIFRSTIGREFKNRYGKSMGFRSASKTKGVRYVIKPLTTKPEQDVDDALAALIKVHGAFDVYGAVMRNADMKIVGAAFNEPTGE